MAKPGTKPKSAKQKEREGNPGKREIPAGVTLPPGELTEPDWDTIFVLPDPEASDEHGSELLQALAKAHRAELEAEASKLRADAKTEWARIIGDLDKSGVLAAIDTTVVVDACVCVARLRQCERLISKLGIAVLGERGWQKNPAVTAANQYRATFKFYIAELGLSPSSRSRLDPPEDPDDDDDIFD